MIKIEIPQPAREIISALENAGFEAYVVGGSVRDAIRGIEPDDWDICTSATPDQMRQALSDFSMYPSGEKYGTMTVMIDEQPYEVTSFRADSEKSDGRRPEKCTFGVSLREDLARRDFTINAMAYNDSKGLVDPFGGHEDLMDGIIRAVGNPVDRLVEDGIRLARAIRFSMVNNFEIEPSLWSAILENQYMMEHVSVERYVKEFKKILKHGDFSREDELAVFLSWLKVYDIELSSIAIDWGTIKNLGGDFPKIVAAMIYENGYDETYAATIAQNLRFENSDKKQIVDFVYIMVWWPTTKVSLKSAMSKVEIESVNYFIEYLNASGRYFHAKSIENFLYEIKIWCEPFRVSHLAINGNDVVKRFGLSGRGIGDALRIALRLVIYEPNKNDKKVLMEFLENNL